MYLSILETIDLKNKSILQPGVNIVYVYNQLFAFFCSFIDNIFEWLFIGITISIYIFIYIYTDIDKVTLPPHHLHLLQKHPEACLIHIHFFSFFTNRKCLLSLLLFDGDDDYTQKKKNERFLYEYSKYLLSFRSFTINKRERREKKCNNNINFIASDSFR
jgi:hypothetical protein